MSGKREMVSVFSFLFGSADDDKVKGLRVFGWWHHFQAVGDGIGLTVQVGAGVWGGGETRR